MKKNAYSHLIARTLLIVLLTNAVAFYHVIINPKDLTWSFAALVTALELLVMFINVTYWWRYQTTEDRQPIFYTKKLDLEQPRT